MNNTEDIEDRIDEIIKSQYNGFRGKFMKSIRNIHWIMRMKIGDQKYLEYIQKQKSQNPRPVYKPMVQ